MNDTTNRQAIQREDTTSNTVNAAGLETSNASTSASACLNHSQAVLLSSTHQSLADEEEQVVTSTSNENSGTTPHHPTSDFPDLTLHSFITSPARITSSTGNDYSLSPTQPSQAREETAHLLLSSEDDSSEQHQATTTLAKARELQKHRLSQQEESNNFNAAMPTTSSAAAASSAFVSTDETPCNHLASLRRLDTVERRGVNSSDKNNGNLVRNSSTETEAVNATAANMVARDSGNNLAGTGTGSTSEPPDNHVEKIILKLPKPNLPPNSNESQHPQYHTRHQQQRRAQEHLLDNDPSMSNSCSNSSTNSSITAEVDTRKVEPLKINLHHGSHQHQLQHHNPSSSSSSTSDVPHVIPKITIKPLFKKSNDGISFENMNSDCNATEAQPNQSDPIPKLTIKATGSSCSIGENTSSEPHIVPKLTIRAANEERGCTHTSVVPKLTIKISDTQSPHGLHNSLHSPPTAKLLGSVPVDQNQQPPLPKLTIKTTLDGASGSSIMSSSISPALSSSNSSSSAASSPHSVVSSLMGSATSAVMNMSSVPKLTIKTMSKNSEELPPIVPKLTIKTSAAGSCVTKAEASISEAISDTDISCGSSSGIKIPKFTIKTGQEHAVIITQHKSDQTIPKLTIKTKSIDLEDAQSETNKEPPPPEKIPKLTIKTPSADSVPPIPKLTISTPHSPKSHCASLVVRQVPAAASPTSSSKTQSPDRLPKLMISRQDIIVNYGTECLVEKTVPKLTIKTTPNISDQDEEMKEKPVKIPKLTIKSLPPPPKETLQSSEDSEDGTSVESGQSPMENEVQQSNTNKVVPKLTITNLGSPKCKLKALLGEKPSTEKLTTETASFGHKKSLKTNAQIHLREQPIQPKNDEKAPANVVANGGESSNSQEFCGFTENTSDLPSVEPPKVCTDKKNQIGTKSAEEVQEVRRSSDDMDIDEGLQKHDPKIFKNITHFGAIRNGESYGIHLDNSLDKLPQMSVSKSPRSIELPSQIVDTVDLTSSPSPGSSPAHFNYTDADPKVQEFLNATSQSNATANALLLECLQRENSVIQTVPRIATATDVQPQAVTPKEKSNSLLLSQLTAPLRYPPPPPLQPRPPPHLFCAAQSSLKYPPFTDRLMANGAHSGLQQQLTPQQASLSTSYSKTSLVPPMNLSHPLLSSATQPATVIDSIEILDTPEGSPRSSQDDSRSVGEFPNHIEHSMQHLYVGQGAGNGAADGLLRHNNNIIHHMSESLDIRHSSLLKRSAKELSGLTDNCLPSPPNKMRRTENLTPTMATLTILTSDNVTNSATIITTSPTIIGGTSDSNCAQSPKSQSQISPPSTVSTPSAQHPTSHHRSRKQKHDNLLDITMDEIDQVDVGTKSAAKQYTNCIIPTVGVASTAKISDVVTPAPKKRGRPRRIRPEEQQLPLPTQGTPVVCTSATMNLSNCSAAERRVQLLRKRLAIDMVSAEQPVKTLDEKVENCEIDGPLEEGIVRRDRAIRTTRRCGTPNSMNAEKQAISATKQRKHRISNASVPTNCEIPGTSVTTFNHFGGSNSSLSSACSSNSSYATTLTTTATASTAFIGPSNQTSLGPINCTFSMSSQIDLTMSSSSSTCSGSTTATLTTVEAGGRSMLPPTKALSSTDPLPDVVFQSKDFSAIMLTQQLSSMQSSPSSRKGSRANSQDGDDMGEYIGSGSGDDSTSLNSPLRTSGRGRGRGRGRGFRGGPRAHRLGRGASAVAKAIAMNRPRCVGGLKHTPDPDRMKGLFTPSPQVFEEDTRMSADMCQTVMNIDPQTPIRQPDFFTNEEESQSSIISNSSVSILDPNTVAAVQNGASVKRFKKKKMEVCAADEIEYTVSSIAEYDWPPPKGCCPSKNRDTFMIQEQVANYLGIKSFKRKYPDLPRRQIDMEERNWLQEKGFVSEKMCDLGITAVWASDILDIMYADFYEKYEEYKDYVRQKHLREIEAKQKSLGLNIGGRGLQARDRAMLSTSKWNAYFNKTRKDERPCCLDLQNFMLNVPLPANVPATTIMNRTIADEIAKAASVERIAEPPTLLKPHNSTRSFEPSAYYPIAVVPGQYTSAFKSYSSWELCALPLNTVINGPLHKENCLTTTAEDTDSVSETCAANESSSKRLKIRRSRRERSERSSKQKCDIISEPRPLSRQSGTIRTSIEEGASYSAATESCSESSSSSFSSSSNTETSSSDLSSDNESEEEAITACSVCQRTQNRNLKDVPELFINCYTCRRKVHPSCIEMPHRMAVRVRNYNWQCADCKCCIKCKRIQEPNKMLFCEQCDRGYHIYCLGVKSVPDVRWSCERCSVCVRCGATKPEGLPQPEQQLPNGEKVKQIKHKKVKWINEYRIDHITKLREHCSMLCVPCGRSRTSAKRVQMSTGNSSHIQGNISRNNSAIPGSTTQQHSPQIKPQLSSGILPTNTNVASSNGTSPLTSSTVSGTVFASNPTSNVASIDSTSPSPPPVVA